MRATGLIRLTHDPELKIASVDGGDRPVCTMRCAIRRFRGRDAGFVDVVAWGGLGKACAERLSAGSAAFVDGQLQQQEWVDAEGQRHQRHRIVADDVQFIARAGAVSDDDIPF